MRRARTDNGLCVIYALYALDKGGRQRIPAFQGFLFGGGVNPYVSRVATFYMRESLVPHVARLVDVYRAKRDAMLKGLWEVLEGTDVRNYEGAKLIAHAIKDAR